MSDLEDFFAKRDKKKSKSKPKFVAADETAKNVDTTSKCEMPSKLKMLESHTMSLEATTGGDEIRSTDHVEEMFEEEWKEYEVEQKDYTGLKIVQLIMDANDNSNDGNDDDDGDSGSTSVGDSERDTNDPWKKISEEHARAGAAKVEKAEKAEKTEKLYVSPAIQHAAILRNRNRTAPDLNNADYFPTLGAAKPVEQRKKKNEPIFEEVRHGSRLYRVNPPPMAPASIANRFQSLTQDDS